jgi:signal transduction histidine kinase
MSYSNKGLFLICDGDGKITSVKYLTDIISDDNLQGKMFIELVSPEYIQPALNFLTEIKKRTASFSWELNLKEQICSINPLYFNGIINEGEIYIFGSPCQTDFKHFLDAIALINTEQNNIIRNISKENSLTKNSSEYIFNELTKVNNELINMQRDLSKTNEKLKESIKFNNYLLGMAAHDLRNPLGNIFNYCDFLEETDITEEQKEFIAEIKYLSKFMLNLVSDMLTVSSIESGHIKLNNEVFDITLLLNNIIKRQKLIANKKNIRIEFNFNEQVIINSDKNKLDQVFTNLISNAIKFSYPNTVINILVSNLEKSILVEVRDQGQGIPPEEQELLFKPFQKTSAKSTAGEPSTGLGLYIVKRIIEASKGKIWVKSEVNKGSSFFVELIK